MFTHRVNDGNLVCPERVFHIQLQYDDVNSFAEEDSAATQFKDFNHRQAERIEEVVKLDDSGDRAGGQSLVGTVQFRSRISC